MAEKQLHQQTLMQGVVQITLPDVLDSVLLSSFLQTLLSLQASAKVLVITGSLESFCLGYDLNFLSQQKKKSVVQFAALAQSIGKFLEEASFVTIAQLNGLADSMGAELALCCDLIVASSSSALRFSGVDQGLTPVMGGLSRLLKQVGIFQAKELLFSAKLLSAPEAFRLGLVNQIASPETLSSVVRELAATLQKKPFEAIFQIKKMLSSFPENPGFAFKKDAQVYAFSELLETLNKAQSKKEAA
jgi:enoyl-CoA hydratase/carnithine racemase